MSTAFIVLQDVPEARTLVEAAEQDNKNLTVDQQPAMVRLEAPGEVVIRKQTVEELTGQEWDPQDIHLVLVSVGGNIDETDDQFRVYWANN